MIGSCRYRKKRMTRYIPVQIHSHHSSDHVHQIMETVRELDQLREETQRMQEETQRIYEEKILRMNRIIDELQAKYDARESRQEVRGLELSHIVYDTYLTYLSRTWTP